MAQSIFDHVRMAYNGGEIVEVGQYYTGLLERKYNNSFNRALLSYLYIHIYIFI
mgnify:CR=1 FL=1